MKCQLKVKSINRRNDLKPAIIFVDFSMIDLFEVTYSCWVRGLWVDKRTVCRGCCVYLAKAAFSQHHEEVEVQDAHLDFGRAGRVDGGAGWDRGRGQGHRERLRQRRGEGMRQRG